MSEPTTTADASGIPGIAEQAQALPVGRRVAEFEMRSVVGIGGFGIVYRAFDTQLQRMVAVKEYFPGRLAWRRKDGSVVARASSMAERFEAGRQSFLNEARLLARFDHPALVKVHRFWEEQGTAYMVMPFYEGRTLEVTRRGWSEPPTQAWMLALLEPLLGALSVLHGARCLHRDVAPDNILLLEDGSPVLLDLGAAREVLSDDTELLTTILKPSFAPIEQYAQSAGLAQGPWTDLYALGAVVYHCVSGRPPTPSAVRAVRDDLRSFRALTGAFPEHFRLQYDDGFTHAIDWALALKPEDRPSSVGVLQRALGLAVTEVAPATNGARATYPDDAEVDGLIREAWATTVMQAMPELSMAAAEQSVASERPHEGARTSLLPWWWRSVGAFAAVGVLATLGVAWVVLQGGQADATGPVASTPELSQVADEAPAQQAALAPAEQAALAPLPRPQSDASSFPASELAISGLQPWAPSDAAASSDAEPTRPEPTAALPSRRVPGADAPTTVASPPTPAPTATAPSAPVPRRQVDGRATVVSPGGTGRAPVIDRSFRSPAARAELQQGRQP